MSLLSDMLCRAGRAGRCLPALRSEAGRFLLSQMSEDGGFRDRAGRSDLYYTAFGLLSLSSLGMSVPPDAVAGYLRRFGGGAGLDLTHLACLARCWACLAPGIAPDAGARRAMLDRLAEWRSGDGGFAAERGAQAGSVYACFLALGALQDLNAPCEDAQAVIRCIQACRSADGGYANLAGQAAGAVPTTAAAVRVLHELGHPADATVGAWLIGCAGPSGGFGVHPAAPAPDLLSTAVALHALAAAGGRLNGDRRRACQNFVLGLRDAAGGFRGHWADPAGDCEYTFYGLLALGHLCGEQES